MSAHIVTALKEWERKPYINEEEFKFFLDFAPCADQLEYAHWSNMHNGSSIFISNYISLILPEYLEQWRALGFPNNREEWVKAKYENHIYSEEN